jgi:hypothetical protein
MIHHGNNRFGEALVELEAAYKLDAQPDLLFAIGQVLVKLSRCGDAIVYYERFLATKPPVKPTAATREAITVCKGRLDSEPPTKVEPAPEPQTEPRTEPNTEPVDDSPNTEVADTQVPVDEPPIDTPPRRRWYKDPIGGVLVGAGLASGVTGVVFYSSARGDLDGAESAGTYQQSEDLVDRAGRKRLYAAIAGGAGAALVVFGVVRYAMSGGGDEAPAVTVAPTSDGGIVAWSGRF